MYCNNILKKIYSLFTFSPWNFSLVCRIILVLFSLFLLCFSIYSLLSTDPNTILPSLWLLFLFFGCGWWRGSVVVVVFSVGHCGGCSFFFFFFFGCDQCLKGLWVVVGSGVWVVGRGWVWCLGRGWVVAEVGFWHGSLWWLWFFFFFWLWLMLKGVMGRGWVRCLGRWSWLGPMFGSWLGCGWSGLLVVDRRSFTWPLSHLLSWIGELGLDRWAGIGWWWVWNGGSVDWLGWSSVAPMVALVMIFFEWICSGGFQIGDVGF